MKKKLVIFDLDGTLLNSIDDLVECTNYSLRKLGYPTHDKTTIRSYVGNGVNKLLERSLPDSSRNPENLSCLRKIFIPYFEEHNTQYTTPYEGITDLLHQLQDQGVMLAVASNKYHSATEKLVKYYFPEINFIKILGQRENVPIKPDPKIVFDIIQDTNIKPEEVLYVGDSDVDLQTAFNAKVDAVGVTWGFRTKSDLSNYQSLGLIDSADELLHFIE
jgi:phosphoglycolate phosphatase